MWYAQFVEIKLKKPAADQPRVYVRITDALGREDAENLTVYDTTPKEFRATLEQVAAESNGKDK